MDALDTYLFYPQAEPHNPYLPAKLNQWQITFSADQAKAFDMPKWGYYTREWAEAWGPFYSDAWITSGCRPEMPVYYMGSRVFLAKSPVTTGIRLEEAKSLRVAGLLWPEARGRIEKSAYLTVESVGKGQVILFATEPGHRAQQRATARTMANAVVYGPGLGASPPVGW